MLEHVHAAVYARPFPVPNRKYAIVRGVRVQVDLLRAPAGSCCQVFVDARLEDDIVLFEVLPRLPQSLVVGTQRRATVTRNKSRGIQTGSRIARLLHERKAYQ